jgi:predicted DsbA family dithiol-disulfide isomerase
MPDEGYQMSELEAAGHSDRVEDHIERLAAKDGFPWHNPPFLPKTHRALTLGELGRDQGEEKHWAMHQAIFGAYFGQMLDIGKEDVLLEIAADQGIDSDVVKDAWETDALGERLHQFRHIGMHMGIDSTPAALICNELLIGSRPYQVLKDSIDRCLVTADNVEEEAAAT